MSCTLSSSFTSVYIDVHNRKLIPSTTCCVSFPVHDIDAQLGRNNNYLQLHFKGVDTIIKVGGFGSYGAQSARKVFILLYPEPKNMH